MFLADSTRPTHFTITDEEIRYEIAPLEASHVELFRKATRTEHSRGIPLTFATYFRWGESKLLDGMNVDLRQLLHTDQEYEFHTPLEVGDKLTIVTRIAESKERSGLKFTRMDSTVACGGNTRLIVRTTFVVRTAKEDAK